MSTSAVSSSSIYQELQTYRQQRHTDVQQLGRDLNSGATTSLANAQQDYNALVALGQSGPFRNGDTFRSSQREQDFNAIGQALQSGDLAGAQHAFAQLEGTYRKFQTSPPVYRPPITSPPVTAPPSAPPAIIAPPIASGSGANSGAGAEIILNLANAPAGEQITIGLQNGGNGAEQVTISAANQQNQIQEQVTLNLNLNTNQQVFLNLFSSPSDSTQGNSLTTTA